MENIGWILYLCGLADSFTAFFGIIGALFGVVSLIYFFYWADSGKGSYKIKYPIISITFILLAMLIPSTKTCYLILGVTETVEYISNNEEIKKLPDNAVKALNYWLEEQVKEDKEE